MGLETKAIGGGRFGVVYLITTARCDNVSACFTCERMAGHADMVVEGSLLLAKFF